MASLGECLIQKTHHQVYHIPMSIAHETPVMIPPSQRHRRMMVIVKWAQAHPAAVHP
jgi:hypothetical protein